MFTETQDAVLTETADAQAPQDTSRVPTDSLAPAGLKEAEPVHAKPRIVEEIIIEEVSIDGMCGVY